MIVTSNLFFMWAVTNTIGFVFVHDHVAALAYLLLSALWHKIAKFMEKP